MPSLFYLPQDVWRDTVISFVPSLRDLVRLDSALTNKLCRTAFHISIRGIKHDWCVESDKRAFKWFQQRYIVVPSVAFTLKKKKETCVGSLLSMMRKVTGRNALHHSRTFERTMQAQSSTLTRLYINTNNIRDVSGLRYAIHLTNLSVFCCQLVTSESFVRGISECTNLRKCSVVYNKLLGEEATAAVLFNCKELRELIVSQPANLDNIFERISQPLKLQKFDWQHIAPIVTRSVLHTIANQMPQLEHLSWIASRRSTFAASEFHQVIRKCVQLKVLQISGPGFFTSQSLLLISQSLTSLRQINLAANAEVSDAGVIALAQGCILLEHLNLSYSHTLTDGAIQAVGTHCQLLSYLNVRECTQLTDNAFRTLNVESLRYLDVSGTQVKGTFTTHLFGNASAVAFLDCTACPNLHRNLLLIPPINCLTGLSLSKISLKHADWLSLSLRLPMLRSLSLSTCAGVDVAVLRSFALNCSALRMLYVTDSYLSPAEKEEFTMWLEARTGDRVFLFMMPCHPY